MTEKEQNIEQCLLEIQAWTLSLQKQFSETRQLSDSESKLLTEVRNMTKRIKPVTPAPAPAPEPPFNYLEASARQLFERLDIKRDVMTPEHRHGYNQLRNLFESDGRTGVSLPWNGIEFLQKLYGTYYFRKR